MRTNHVIWLAIIVSILCMNACSASTPAVKSADYEEVEPLEEYQSNNAMWAYRSEEEWIKSSDLIFKGKVLDKSEYLINDQYSSCVGVIKYRVADIIYSTDKGVKKGSEINILTMNTSHSWASEAIDQKVDQDYIILATITNNKIENNPYNFFETVSKYCLFDPFTCVVTITDEGAKFHKTFSTLVQNAQPSTRIRFKDLTGDCYVMNEQDFIADLKKLKEKYQ